MNQTDKRVKWLTGHKAAIIAAKSIVGCNPKGGTNARTRPGMSPGGFGYWARALTRAGITTHIMNYWSGSNPTPSTAINGGIGEYIFTHAPEDLK